MKKSEREARLAQLETQLASLQRQAERLQYALEHEQDRWSQLTQEYNALLTMLDDLFNIQVGARHLDGDTPLWDITDVATGERLVSQQKDIAEAYRLAISKRMEAKQ